MQSSGRIHPAVEARLKVLDWSRKGAQLPFSLTTDQRTLSSRQICARHISNGAAHQNVGGIVLLGGYARQAHRRGKSVRPPLYPLVVRITMRQYAGKRPARR